MISRLNEQAAFFLLPGTAQQGGRLGEIGLERGRLGSDFLGRTTGFHETYHA